MFPQVFEIRIDNESKKFFAGQVVEGRVILGICKDTYVTGIDIRLTGKGNVHWDSGIKHNHVFSESELYVDKTFNLFVPDEGRQVTLHPGTYEYYFSIPLPCQIPSSLEGTHCFIKYFLEAVIHRPWKDDQTVEELFYVISISDLNVSPHAALPTSFQSKKNVGFNPCQNGPISLAFMIGKTGFVPGEYLQFGLEVRNTSGVKVNGVHIYLKRLINCHAKGETKSLHDKFTKLNGPSAEGTGYLLWQSNFEIPPLPPTKLMGCQIIDMQYFVEIKLKLDKWVDLKYTMPIIIGTIPFENQDKCVDLQALEITEKTSLINVEKKARSTVASPIIASEFKYDNPWNSQHSIRSDHTNNAPRFNTNMPMFPTLPPLDLALFQPKPERNPYFKSFEDCDCEFSYPYRIMSPDSHKNSRQPPRPHSNPGHFWEKSEYWEEEDQNE